MSRLLAAAAIMVSLLVLAMMSWRHVPNTFQPTTVAGKRILITGADSGIGAAVALQYAKLGARLLLVAPQEAALTDTAAACSRLGAMQVGLVTADLFHRKSREQVLEATHRDLGGLDVLILAHGHFNGIGWWAGNADNMTSLFKDLNLNFFGYADLVSRTLPMLQATGGAIGVASTLASHIGLPGQAPQVTSSFAARGFFAALRLELQRHASAVSVTMCYLGLLGSEAEPEVGGRTGSGAPSGGLAKEAAMAVVEAVAMGNREVYFPAVGAMAVLLNAIYPDMMESRIQNFVAR